MTSHRIHQKLRVEELEQRVAPATLYVSPTGDNGNSGTLDSPWATPGYASRQLSPGDTLVVLGGRYVLDTYDEDIITPPSGTADAWVTISGETGDRPVLAGGDNLAMAIDLSGASYVRIENLEITHDDQATGSGTYFREGIDIIGEPASHIVLDDLYIHHIDEFGLDFQDINDLTVTDCVISYCGFGAIGGPGASVGGWQNVRIEDCTLSYSGHYYQGGDGSTRPYDRPDGFGIEPSAGPILIVNTTAEHNYGDGLDSKASNTTISNCVVANNSCDGVKLWDGTSRIENTLIYGRGDGDSTPTPWAAIVIGCDNANATFEIVNTTVHDTLGGNYIMYAQYDETTTPIDLTIRNSIFSGTDSIFLRDVVTLTAENNLFYTPGSSTVLTHGDTDYTSATIGSLGTGNTYGDPLFVSPAWGQTGDYHLQTGSPAIDAGTAAGAPATDLDGATRDAAPDIGAYEYVSVSPGDPMTGWSGKIILGNHVGGQTVDGELDYQGLLAEDQALQQITGRHIAFVNLETLWNWDYWPSQALDDLVAYDAVPMFNFKPWAEWDVTDPAYSLDAIIAGQQDAYLDQVAAFAVNYNRPIIISFACEMNGDWFPWSGVNNGGGTLAGYGDPTKPDGPERYVDAYRHVVDRFRADGADNVIWVFQPDAYSAPETSWNRADAYYPGDNYVDWLGVSVYGKQTNGDDDYPFRQGLDSAYTMFTDLAPSKPVMVAEWGRAELSPSGSKAQWITSALTDLAANRWPNVRAVCYWDEAWTNDDNSVSDLRINSSTASRDAYRSGIANTQLFVDTWHPSVGGSVNTPPAAVSDSATVSQNSANNVINVLSNDTDADGDTLTVTAVGSAGHGAAALASGQVRYTPTSGYAGSDSFSYTISDGNGGTASATVNVTVTGQVQPQPMALGDVQYWAYQLQGISDTGAVTALVQSQYDMLVLEPTRTDWSSDDMNFDTAGMVTQLKDSLASDGQHRKMVLAYMDIAQAEDWRWYWTWSTETSAGPSDPLPGDWPDFIVGRDPDGWVGCYPVAYWDADWKDIVIYGQNTGTDPRRDYVSMIDEAIRDGFDGIYLDWVEAFEDSNVIAAAQAAGVNPEQEMVDFIGEMRTYALARDPDFVIIQQNASALLDGHPELLNVIDGIAQESIWYQGDATDSWSDPDGYDDAVPASWRSEYLANLAQFQSAGLPVFNCEYAVTHADTAYANSYARGFVPYVSRTPLSRLTTTPPPSLGSNTAPTANNDSATVDQDSASNVINVLSNDTDADGDALTVTAVGSASHGTAQLVTGQVRYTPTTGYSGSDSFSYTIGDGNGGTDSATVSVTVTPTSTSQDIFFLHQSCGAGIMADHGGNPGMVSQLQALGHTFDDYSLWNSPPGGSIPTEIASLFADTNSDGTYGDAFQTVSALNGGATADVLMLKSCFYTLWELETASNLNAWQQAFISNVAAYANQNPDQKIVVMPAVPLRSESGLSDAAAARARDWGEWLEGEFITTYTTQGNVYSFDLFDFYADAETHATNADALKRIYCRSGGDEHPNDAGYTAAANAIVTYLDTTVLPGGGPPPPEAPEIVVQVGSTNITDGQTTAISFGTVNQGQTGPTQTFTVRNIGTETLTLGAVSLPTGFTLTEGLASSLAGGASDTFTVRLDTATLGTKSGEISFTNNDSDENPFNFTIAGVVATTDVDLTIAIDYIDLNNPMQIGDEMWVGTVQSNSSAGTDVDGEYAVAFYLSANTTAGDADDVLLGRVTDDWVGAGDSTWSDGSFAIPAGTAEGSYYLYAVVDADGDVAESNESNNTAWSDSAAVTVAWGRILRSGDGVMRFSDGDDRLMVIYAGPGYAIVKDASGGSPEESDSPIASIDIYGSTLSSKLIVKDIDGGGTPDTMTLGRVTTGVGDSLGMIQIMGRSGQVQNTTIDVDGSLRKFLLKGDADSLDLAVGADLDKLLVLGAVNSSAISVGGDTALARFKGGMVGTTFDVAGTVRKVICTGGVSAGSTVTLGSLEKVLLVRGEMAGTIDVTASAAPGGRNSNMKILGELSGSLLAGVFGNVRVMGTFTGQIGDAGTSAGSGNLLLIRDDGGGTITPADAFERMIGI